MKLLLVMLLSITCFAAKHAPLPRQLLDAKTVYVDGRTYANVTDDVYDELLKWKRFAVVSDRSQADLIFRVSADGEAENSTLSVIDPMSGASIWSITRDWGTRLNNAFGHSSGRALVRDLRRRMGK